MDKNRSTVTLDNFNLGGLSSSKWRGLEDTYYKLIGLNLHDLPGIIEAEQKMTDESDADAPDELCKWAVNCSDGSQYWFSSESGKIWERPSDGNWRLVHTTTPAAGEAKCLGAAEYQGRIWWATQSRLHYITVANANGNDWASDAVEDAGTFGVTDLEFHPMYAHPAQQILYIGDGNQLAQVEGTTFSANALDIASPLRIKCIGQIGTDILIGTYVANNVTKTEIIRWNGYSVSFTSSDPIPEVGINAFLPADNLVLVQAGVAGNIYWYDGANLELYMKIPGEYTSSATAETYPASIASRDGQILFGYSNKSGNPADQGIYRIGRHDRNYPRILDLPYPISQRSGSDFVLTGVQIGAILTVGSDVYASWKTSGGAGVDKLDSSTKLDGAYFETRVISVNRMELANFADAMIAYASLPASTAINFYLDRNYAGYGSALSKYTDTGRNMISTKDEGVEFTTLQLRVKLTTNNNDSPQIESGKIILR